MAAKMCNADRLAERVSVFITDFIRNTYGFLTPNHVDQLRSFRNEVEDNYPACILTAPWKDTKRSAASNDSETETDEDPIPSAKRTRKLSDSTPEKESESIYKDYSTPETSDPFTTPSKKRSDPEWTGSVEEEDVSDSDHSGRIDMGARRIQIPFTRCARE